MNPRVGLAGPSELSLAAGVDAVHVGGGAVDAAVAMLLTAMCSEIGMVALDAGAFVTVWGPGEAPVVLDGSIAMPGRGAEPRRFGAAVRPVRLGYGGGMQTLVGPGSVGVGGALAAMGEVCAGWGRLPWARVVQAAAGRLVDGFPMGTAAHAWLSYSHREIYGQQADSAEVIHDRDGTLLPIGSRLRVPGLDWTLELLAREGAGSAYHGTLAERIVACVQSGGGLLSAADLAQYRVLRPQPLAVDLDDWRLALPPSQGGRQLADMLARLVAHPAQGADAAAIARLAEAQHAVFAATLESQASASTVHVSALDDSGLACAITASSGYGSGLRVPGTGIWLNNCLGEMELTPEGLHRLPVGARIRSNMSPLVGRGPAGEALALGSPGAERITSALLQVLLAHLRQRLPLDQALAAPRLHVERCEGGWQVAAEPGLPLQAISLPVRRFDAPAMFFGGAAAVRMERDGQLDAQADPRRRGQARVVSAEA